MARRMAGVGLVTVSLQNLKCRSKNGLKKMKTLWSVIPAALLGGNPGFC
jgi:hypothetical protein